MKKKNKELLDLLIEKKLNESLENGHIDSETFEEAMDAIDRQIELDNIKKEKLMKLVEIGAIVIATPLIEYGCKKAFAKMICTFESDNIFTTTAGRSLSSLFKFK